MSLSTYRKTISIVLFLLLLTCAALVRVYGLQHDLPYLEEIDEVHIFRHALLMFTKGDPDPGWYNYPTFSFYFQSSLYAMHYAYGVLTGLYPPGSLPRALDWDLYYIFEPGYFLWGRSGIVLFAVATIALLFVVARTFSTDKRAAWLAALLLAFSTPHIIYARFMRTDIPLTFYVLLAFYFQLRVAQRGARRDYFFAGLVTGLAVATKYNGFVIGLPLVVAHLYNVRTKHARLFNPNALLGMFAAPLGFFIGAPFAALHLPTVIAALGDEARRYRPGEGGVSTALRYLEYLAGADGIGIVALGLAAVGMVVAARRHRIEDVLALTFTLGYFAFVALEATRYVRNILVLLPFLALFGAQGILSFAAVISARVPRAARYANGVAALILLFALLLPAFEIARTSAMAATPTTRAQATTWAENNLLPQAYVFTEPNGIKLSKRFGQAEPAPLSAQPREWYLARRFDYLISAAHKNDAPPPAWLSEYELIQEFLPTETRWGPTVRIYRLPVAPLPVELVKARTNRARVKPGDAARVDLQWRATERLVENFGVFVHLTDATGNIVAQADTQPQTKNWRAGEIVNDAHELEIPQDVPAGRYELQVGFFRPGTERVMPLLQNGQAVTELAPLTLIVASKPPDCPAPAENISARFGADIALIGYARGAGKTTDSKPGDALPITLVWRAENEVASDWVVFAQLLAADGRIAAQADHRPANGAYPTSVWQRAETVCDAFTLSLAADLAPGAYELYVGLYQYPSLARVAAFRDGARAPDDAIRVTEIRVRE